MGASDSTLLGAQVTENSRFDFPAESSDIYLFKFDGIYRRIEVEM